MTAKEIENIVSKLADTSVDIAVTDEEREVNFAGKGLKLNSESDAKEVVEAIKNCKGMTVLCLEGNTVGTGAAKAIGKALEGQPNFKRALWKDMFTGRLKTEIPEALNYLSAGIMLAPAYLVELDLSDNAFGPVGVPGIVPLLKSSSCFTLQELKLNNNGLGIEGGKMLAQALMDSHKASKNTATPFSLKVFVCGRNRLENEGAKAFASVFKALGTLEEVQMPQNGIYHEGIGALASALASNSNLRHINLNDNTFTDKGAKAFAEALSSLQRLEVINFGDCLIKTQGAEALGKALMDSQYALKELCLGFNEIGQEGGVAIAEAMRGKEKLEKLELDGNHFGNEGCEMIERVMEAVGKLEKLGSLSDDEGSDSDEDEDEEDEEEEETDEDDENKTIQENLEYFKENQTNNIFYNSDKVLAADFLATPSSTKLLKLGSSGGSLILSELGNKPTPDAYIEAFIKISSVIRPESDLDVKTAAQNCADAVFMAAYQEAGSSSTESVLTNTLLVYLGLIKSEDKKFRPVSDLYGPIVLLEHIVKQGYFKNSSKDVLHLFFSRPNKALNACGKVKHSLLQALYQFQKT
ncbi:ran GTPase-activating protein 1-like [Limulus polyphemus]|uniref:Ran GTPase-activating protein 1-like n=1 Tax=Limulus polyphemus TaxID=6850 RepID=A0ABM1B5N2_LIMPO|nr:ran GTPase-activating protein 1-like [Limulus polyphemus]